MSEAVVEGNVDVGTTVPEGNIQEPGQQAESAPAPEANNWADSLGDYKDLADKYSDVQGLAKAYKELNTKLSSQKPPETPEAYTLPDVEGFQWNEDTVEKFGPALKELGLNQDQASALLTLHAQDKLADNQLSIQANENNLNALKQEWGESYDTQVAAANKAIERLGGDALFEVLESNPLLGSNPEIIKAFAKVAELTSESSLPDNQAPSGKMSKAEALTQMSELMDRRKASYNQAERVALQADIDKLHAIIGAQ